MGISKERVQGCIVGGAIGDAFGGPYEGQGPPVKLQEDCRSWQLSDDTQLTLATCKAIVDRGWPCVEAIAESFARWYRAGRVTGVGASTLKALSELAVGQHWALTGRKGEMAAGNGAAMRIAPLAFFLDPSSDSDRSVIRDVCRITHHNDEAYAGALAIVSAIRLIADGLWRPGGRLVPLLVDGLPDTCVRDAIAEVAELDSRVSIMEIASVCGTSGYVAESVPLALCGAEKVRELGFAEMIRQLVQAGGDTDTIASMAGNVAGADIGMDGIPREWVDYLPERDEILEMSERLVRCFE